ncbi:MAG: mechanosensitive ion channel family protein [Chloroflexi bacterium]|nr:mechanosensitive ion channel family protein [Chloroflexota bacterium]
MDTISLQNTLAEFLRFLPRLVTALLLFLVSLVVATLAAKAARRAMEKRVPKSEIVRLMEHLVRWSIVTMGTLAALDQVNFDVSSFVAGLGIAGFTIGFALQDIARNFVAGILLLLRQPFRIGDVVEAAGYTGKVLDINIRDTVIHTFDGRKLILPNMSVFSGPIINLTELPLRRRSVEIGLGYGQDAPRAIAAFLDAVSAVSGVAKEPAPAIYAQALGASAMSLALFFWIDQNDHNILQVHSEVVIALEHAAIEHGIELPYPIQEVRIKGDLLEAAK